MIKMVVTDLDGTLFGEGVSISARNLAALANCRARGIKVVVATGRSIRADELIGQGFDGRVFKNGAVAYVGDKEVVSQLIPGHLARPLLLAMVQQGLNPVAARGLQRYTNKNTDNNQATSAQYEEVDFAFHQQDVEDIYLAECDPDDIAFIAARLPAELYQFIDRESSVQVMLKHATKAEAVLALAELWGIKAAEIIAFGDDLNDLPLLLKAGVGVAMGNAIAAVQEAADAVCLTNLEDGVAQWLEQHVLLQSPEAALP